MWDTYRVQAVLHGLRVLLLFKIFEKINYSVNNSSIMEKKAKKKKKKHD